MQEIKVAMGNAIRYNLFFLVSFLSDFLSFLYYGVEKGLVAVSLVIILFGYNWISRGKEISAMWGKRPPEVFFKISGNFVVFGNISCRG